MVRCDELIGKTVGSFCLHEDGPYGPEVHIEFTDGTVFNCCLKNTVQLDARMLRKAHLEPELVKEYSTNVPH